MNNLSPAATSAVSVGSGTRYGSMVLQVKSNGIALLHIDCPGKNNTLSSSTMQDLRYVLEQVAVSDEVKAVVLLSGKPHMFVSGADLREILSFNTPDQAFDLVKRGHEVFNLLSNSSKPTIAGIHGVCLGGGLELALCCHRRVAATGAQTILGLPETTLGLIPGLGGTQRLPELVGLKPALDIILSGAPLSASEALNIGLIDELVQPDQIVDRSTELALELIAAPLSHTSKLLNHKGLLDIKSVKSTLRAAERAIRIRAGGNYPSFGKAIAAIAEGIFSGPEAGFAAEAAAFSELATSTTAANLIELYFTQELAARSAKGVWQKTKQQIGIVGAGLMGTSISCLAAGTGHSTILLSGKEFGLHPQDLSKVSAVIEAIPENLELKTSLFKQLELIVPIECLLASNTSCLPITRLADSIATSDRFVGMHFFHPVERMQLVEIITHPHAGNQSVNAAACMVVGTGKTPLIVNDSPGFLVNRVLCPYLIESALMAEEGIPLNWIEDAALAFGMPLGPFALMDEIGLDVSFKVARFLHDSFCGRLPITELMKQMEDMQLLGKKKSAGFYSYDQNGKRICFNDQLVRTAGLSITDSRFSPELSMPLQQRLILPMIDEAARCLSDKVVRKQRQVDLGMVLGVGFPRFRGGPLRYADSVGIPQCIQMLEQIYSRPVRVVLARKAGRELSERNACDLLYSLSAENIGFYARSQQPVP